MASSRAALRLPGAARREALAGIPGSNDHSELFWMLRDTRRFFHERFERHGRIFKTRFVYPVVFLIGDEANRAIMVTERHDFSFGQGYAQTAVNQIFENSIMLLDGEAHQRTRDILKPAVGRLALRDCVHKVHEVWSEVAESVRGEASADAYTFAETGTFNVVAKVLTGLELASEVERLHPLFEDLKDGIMAATPLRIPFGRLDKALKAREKLKAALIPKVLAARERPPSGLVGQMAHYRDEHGEPMDATRVVEHLLLLFWAGYDTTASAASWIVHTLAQRPDWQERLRTLLADVVGDDITNIEKRRELEPLGWFLLEIERLYPSALFFPRIALRDFEFAGHTIPEGTPTFYSPYMSHRDPEAFEHPDTFDPERWSNARGDKKASSASLVGFGGGPRLCLGKAFAKLQLKVMIHALLSRYRLEPAPTGGFKIKCLPVHHPSGSIVRFKPL